MKRKEKADKRLSVPMTETELEQVKIKAARLHRSCSAITRELWARLLAGEIKI